MLDGFLDEQKVPLDRLVEIHRKHGRDHGGPVGQPLHVFLSGLNSVLFSRVSLQANRLSSLLVVMSLSPGPADDGPARFAGQVRAPDRRSSASRWRQWQIDDTGPVDRSQLVAAPWNCAGPEDRMASTYPAGSAEI